jgi:(p)ppGpp synthase/HD superfamily hydrolase
MSWELTTAKTLAKLMHAGQKYGDADYFETHVLDVYGRVAADPNANHVHKIVAILHDIVEDTPVSFSDLYGFGFRSDVLNAIKAITRMDGEDYLNKYIPRVKENSIAALVKYHDLRSNTNKNTPASLADRNRKAAAML